MGMSICCCTQFCSAPAQSTVRVWRRRSESAVTELFHPSGCAPCASPLRSDYYGTCGWSFAVGSCRRLSAVTCARRRGASGTDPDERNPRSSGFQFTKRHGRYRLQYNEYEAEVREDEAWKVAVPLLGGLVLAAAVIGPLVIGVAFTAAALGAALSAGALFTSLFLPFFLLAGAGALMFGGLAFSAFATLGTALLLPKLISMAVAAVGLGAGALAVSAFLKPAADKAKVTYEEADRRRGGPGGGSSREPEPVVEAEAEAEPDPEVERQLREFDELLAEREQRRRAGEGQGRRGQGPGVWR